MSRQRRETLRPVRVPVILTFLAPASRCNQRCPRCILDLGGEPVREFDLTPDDFGRFVSEFLEAGVPVHSVSFQGYEITLPESWPYLERVFEVARAAGVRRSFITNGMLLAKHVDRIVDLDPVRIAVSLDGGTPDANDAIRGLAGAFHATLRSVKRFVEAAPKYRSRVSVVSCLHKGRNYQSLLQLPARLRDLGIEHWLLGFEVGPQGARFAPLQERSELETQLGALRQAADACGLQFYVNDEFGFVSERSAQAVRARRVFDPDFLVRLDPSGHVRVGHEVLELWREDEARRWVPGQRSAVGVMRYWERLRRSREARPVR